MSVTWPVVCWARDRRALVSVGFDLNSCSWRAEDISKRVVDLLMFKIIVKIAPYTFDATFKDLGFFKFDLYIIFKGHALTF